MRALDRKLLAYSAATAAGLTTAGAAHADIVYTPGPFPVTSGNSYNVNFNGDAVSEFSFNNQAGVKNSARYYGNGTLGSSGVANTLYGPNSGSTRPTALNVGDLINGSLSYAADPGGNANTLAGDGSVNGGGDDQNSGYFPTDGSVKYAGIRFSVGSDVFYGWVGISLQDPASDQSTGTVTGYAYERTPGQGIAAGAIPEPSGLALLALGATGLLRRKDRAVR